ncbi:dihydroxyacetone kinase subunit DhaL [Geodermatophilus amargosae]|uniref:dihydroxyacetone kinase subunit DhaL n=1 Tax=Geodermatophilus amargosae TaxID=1296565 RepID=UPI0034DE3A4D
MSVAVGVDDLTAWLRRFAEVVHERRDELTALDAAIGDADHGSNVDRGMAAVVAVLDDAPPADAAGLLKKTGATLVSKVGGASGPLYGTLFLRMAGAAGNGDLDDAAVARALRAGLDGVVARGKAEPGDKTMVDALGPACDALDAAVEAGDSLADALDAAAAAAAEGRDATVPLVARKGRASYLGERSAGHMDPGATSVTMLVEAAAATLGRS